MFSFTRFISLLLSLSLLGGCTISAQPEAPSSVPQTTAPNSEQGAAAEQEGLPDEVANQVKAQLSEELGVTSLQVKAYSRETWSDGCLGLGGPAEACLAALTEGWQVEVMDTATGQSYVYRTTLNGDSVRRSP
ncbi:hypothetical protein C1752_01867 [Acaryochloris thomasi RCC1774]|uniref:Lipoprotein n=1 Tax=Acaryochloris thomasi RCC1774 TaxID=1764569 RepID=A0A2W1JKU1_9CYAN|nr:hypothetical protein [Acaryochloris thomasi]PZD73989.1 hypothetical protein C1752_01867 [Acaryochloris thomasi RCC1774]